MAVAASSAHVPIAVERLRGVPEARRPGVLGALLGAAPSVPARRVAAELLLGWGDPERAWTLVEGTTNNRSAETAQALRRVADLAGVATPAGRRVRALALARLAEIVPAPLVPQARAEAARALLEAGEYGAALELLEVLVGDAATPPEVQRLAQVGLIRALLQSDSLDAVAARLAAPGLVLTAQDRLDLGLDLARAHLARGEPDAAAKALASDSSVEATGLKGWVALQRGELERAAALFRDAGPYAGRPGEATTRSQMLALLQRIPVAHSPPLGAALRQLARGDSADAVHALREVGRGLDAGGGRPEVFLLAGQIAARLGGAFDALALALLQDVVRAGGTGGAAPAAELAWAQVLLRQGLRRDAIEHLERLILTYPESALVPQARRELERVRGAIPRS
jgi:tetratricopeptide (TPR) repeat protein